MEFIKKYILPDELPSTKDMIAGLVFIIMLYFTGLVLWAIMG